jgi:hypothetical protein
MLRQALAKGAPWGAALTRPFASAADSASAALQTAGERDFMRYTSPVPSTFDHTEGLAGPPTKVRFRAHPYMHRAIGLPAVRAGRKKRLHHGRSRSGETRTQYSDGDSDGIGVVDRGCGRTRDVPAPERRMPRFRSNRTDSDLCARSRTG